MTPRERTPHDVVFTNGQLRLLRFWTEDAPGQRPAVLLVPSLINRWYILDLRAGSSVVEKLKERFDVFCIDWGAPEDEDRYIDWDGLFTRIDRCVRRVQRISGNERVLMLGYCMGGTLSAIYTATHPEKVLGLVNLAGPIDFASGGLLRRLVDPRWFDSDAIADAGNISAEMMQSGFFLLRPTLEVSKMIRLIDQAFDEEKNEAYWALERWAKDNVAFPAAAYRTYIQELYQQNALVRGEHRVLGRRVDLGAISCPVLSVVASRDSICPKESALALNQASGSRKAEVIEIPGGHVGAVVGAKAATALYPPLSDWIGSAVAA